jgi:hypothetical protein
MASIALFAELDEARFQLANFSSAFLLAAMLDSPRKPSRTMRIFSSDEWRLRVARRIFFTSRSDGDSGCTDFCLISTP